MNKTSAEKAFDLICKLYEKAKHGRTRLEMVEDPVLEEAWRVICRGKLLHGYKITGKTFND